MKILSMNFSKTCLGIFKVWYKGLSISDKCKCSMPCQHWVVLPSGEAKIMRGDKIYKIISKDHPRYDHFKEYGKWIANAPIRKLKYELAEIQSKKEWAKIHEKRRQEEEASNYNKPDKFVQPEFCVKRIL